MRAEGLLHCDALLLGQHERLLRQRRCGPGGGGGGGGGGRAAALEDPILIPLSARLKVRSVLP